MDTKHWQVMSLSLLLQTVSCEPHSRKSLGRMNSSRAEKQSASERGKQEHQLKRRWSPPAHWRTGGESTSSNAKRFPAACSFSACRSLRSRSCCWGMLWGFYGDAMDRPIVQWVKKWWNLIAMCSKLNSRPKRAPCLPSLINILPTPPKISSSLNLDQHIMSFSKAALNACMRV